MFDLQCSRLIFLIYLFNGVSHRVQVMNIGNHTLCNEHNHNCKQRLLNYGLWYDTFYYINFCYISKRPRIFLLTLEDWTISPLVYGHMLTMCEDFLAAAYMHASTMPQSVQWLGQRKNNPEKILPSS